MFRRKRRRPAKWKLLSCLLLLVFCFLLLMVRILNPVAKDVSKERASQLEAFIPREGYQANFGEPQEMIDAWEDSRQYLSMEGMSPFISLRQDELLVAVESPGAKRSHSKTRKGYRMVGQQRRQEEGKQGQDPELPFQSFLPKEDGIQTLTDAGELAVAGLEMYGFNEALSKQIPLHRELPEIRHPLCLRQEYSPKLPTVSVIICFHDEPWSTLLRTVHSVLDTSPRDFLREIILVDDLSEQEYLKSSLSEYVSKLADVKLIRSNKRLGVTRGRMLGAARATGDVVVFMDSHCECHRGWLEPLLDRLASDRRRIVSPVIDIINWKTLQYYHTMDLQIGVFDWKLDFHWKPLPEREKNLRESPISPIRSPAVPGGAVAVHRQHFQKTGGYDSDMTLWGAENLELSIKAWLCGGSVEILPCSRVGHVSHVGMRDDFLNEEAVERNKIRIAETWLDSFKYLFYKHDKKASLIHKAETLNYTEHLQLRKGLGCKHFQWFITNVYPELHPLQHRASFSGKAILIFIYSCTILGKFCAEYRFERHPEGGFIDLSACSDSISQHFEYNGMKEICFGSTSQLCFDVKQENIVLQNCTKEMENSPQQWDMKENGMIVHILSGKCLEATNTDLPLQNCNKEANLMWEFDNSFHQSER